MKRIFTICFVSFMLLSMMTKAQENKIKVKWSGFVAAETYWDSRKTVSSRNGAIMFFPTNVSPDANGEDLNDRSELYMNAVGARLRATVSGFNAFGGVGSAVIEGDFSGTKEDYTGLFRLRHAFVKLDWEKDQLIAGKTWHPMFVVASFPRVLHFGGGIPFGVLGRAPQLRYTRKLSDVSTLSFTLMSDLDFASKGPDGKSAKYMQQSSLPEFCVQAKTHFGAFELGATAGYKTLMPLTETIAQDGAGNRVLGIKTDETIGSYYSNAWLTLTTDKFKWNTQAIYGQNMASLAIIGGYAVSNVKTNGEYEYTNIKTMNFTSDIYTTTGTFRYGFNASYSKNLGADDDIAMNNNAPVGIYSTGSKIDYMYQLAPRVEMVSGRFMFGTELTYTATAYGDVQIDATVDNTNVIDATRLMFLVKYAF